MRAFDIVIFVQAKVRAQEKKVLVGKYILCGASESEGWKFMTKD